MSGNERDDVPQHSGHLRHRPGIDHAGLLRDRSGSVGGRRSPELVGRRGVRGRQRAPCAACQRKPRRCSAGESGLIALDWNNGNRTILVDARLTGLIVGQTLHTTRAEIYRALIEATAFGARAIIDRIREYGVAIDRVVCCGGIAEKNDLFMQIYADVLGQPMLIAGSAQTPALGAAISAAVTAGSAAGGYDDWGRRAALDDHRQGHSDSTRPRPRMTSTIGSTPSIARSTTRSAASPRSRQGSTA